MITATMFRDSTRQELTEEQEKLKREIYERMNPRRRKFIDRIGYDNWDPFPEPNEPVEIRKDVTQRTAQQLMQEFIRSKKCEAQLAGESGPSEAFIQGAMEAAVGVVNKQDKFLGTYEFAAWYHELLKKEGHI